MAIAGAALVLGKRLNLVDGLGVLAKGSAWKAIGLGYLALFVTKYIGGVVLFMQYGDNANTVNQAAIEDMSMSPILLVALVAIMAPIVEEFVFRGLLQGKVCNNSYVGLIISSILFGALHMPTDLGSWIIYGGMGLVLGFVYLKTKKLEYSIAIHFINNLLGVIVMILFY